MTRAEAIATASAALRAFGRGVVRAAVYLGPVLIAAVVYIAKLCADAVAAVRALLLRRARAKTPTQLPEYEQREAALREAHAMRWTAWRALPAQRRLAVRVAAVALVVVAGALLRARFTTSAPDGPTEATATAESSPATLGAFPDLAANRPPPPPPIDMNAAAARFDRDGRGTSAGQWTFLTEGPVLAPGPRGEFDDFTIASPWVLREGDGGRTRYRMWYRGCYFRGRDRGCAVGHATSADGVRWQKTKGPVFEPSDPAGRSRLNAVTVARSGDRYFMWYSVTPELLGPRQPSTLHLVTSADGLRWEAAGQVLATTERGPQPMEPSALHDGSQFHLWFSDSLRTFEKNDFELQAGAPFLMHFTSPDGRTWQESGRFPVKPTGLDNFRAVVEPRKEGGFHAMGLEGREYVRFVSPDGNDWERDTGATTRIDPRSLSADVWYITDGTALERDGGALVWFVTQRQSGREEIRVAFRKGT